MEDKKTEIIYAIAQMDKLIDELNALNNIFENHKAKANLTEEQLKELYDKYKELTEKLKETNMQVKNLQND